MRKQFYLPTCSAPQLNLVAATDVQKSIAGITDGGSYKKIHRSAMAKCQTLWNKSRQSSKAADIIKSKLSVYLIVPVATRWHSLHSSLMWLCKYFADDKINQICEDIGLQRFKENEIELLKEYADTL